MIYAYGFERTVLILLPVFLQHFQQGSIPYHDKRNNLVLSLIEVIIAILIVYEYAMHSSIQLYNFIQT